MIEAQWRESLSWRTATFVTWHVVAVGLTDENGRLDFRSRPPERTPPKASYSRGGSQRWRGHRWRATTAGPSGSSHHRASRGLGTGSPPPEAESMMSIQALHLTGLA